MSVKYKCIKKNYSGSRIVSMDLVNLSTGQTFYAVSIPSIKDKILTGEIELEGFSVENGKLQDKRSTKSYKSNDILTEYYNSCKILGIKPLKIVYNNGEYVLVEIPTGADVIIPKFVSRISITQNKSGVDIPQLPALKQNDTLIKLHEDNNGLRNELVSIKNAIVSLEQNMKSGFESSADALKHLHEDIESQGLTVQGYVDSLTEKLDFIVNANIKKYEFPNYKNDRHYLSHYSKVNVLHSEQDLVKENEEMTSKYGNLIYNKDLFNIIEDICKLVNDIRNSMEEIYSEDIKRRNIEGVRKNKAKVHDLVRLVEYGWIFQAGAELLKIGSTLTVYTVFGAGLSAIGYALVEAVPAVKTTKNKLNEYRSYDGGDINPRLDGVYNGTYKDSNLTPVKDYKNGDNLSRTPIQSAEIYNISSSYILGDESLYNSFSMDIKGFVIDCLNTLVRKSMADFTRTKPGKKDEDYYRFIKGSLCSYPVVEVPLFKFYCYYYLTDYAVLHYKDTTDGYTLSNSDIKAKKVYFDLVVNAYFVAKKLLVNQDNCDFLRGALKTRINSQLLYNFLYVMKIALISQGISLKYTETLLDDFVKYSDLVYLL